MQGELVKHDGDNRRSRFGANWATTGVEPQRRADVREQLGASVNSSSLRMESRAPNGETSLQRIAALGMAVLHIRHGADRGGQGGGGMPIAEAVGAKGHEPNPQDWLAGELAGDLAHLRDGDQRSVLPKVVQHYAMWVAYRGRFMDQVRFPDRARLNALLPKFALWSVHEWLSGGCPACGASGVEERAQSGRWVKPQGRMARNAIFRQCSSCHGTRRGLPSHTARRVALGITTQEYEAEHWGRLFNASLAWLTRLLYRRLNRPLTRQLERSKKRF